MTKALKIYLSAPMRGVPDENRPLFREWATRLRKCGFEVWTPPEIAMRMKEYSDGADPTIGEYLARDLRIVCTEADAVLVLRDRPDSKGVYAEKAAARAVGIPVLFAQLDGTVYGPDPVAYAINEALTAP